MREKQGPQAKFAAGVLHLDIPLSIGMQRELLFQAGFSRVGVIWKEAEAVVLAG